MKYVPAAVSKFAARKALLARKHSPELLFATGITSMVGSTVLACRATLKVEAVLDKAEGDLSVIERNEARADTQYTEKEREKDKRHIQMRTGRELIQLYAPAVGLGAVGVAALAQSHNILSKRNAALTAAYVALEEGFAKYRERVVEKYGEEEDRHLRYGTREEMVQDEDDHRKHHKVTRVSLDEPSIYAKFFDPLSLNWSKDPEVNLLFLKAQQNYANDLLIARGHVFLNEVYDMLGLPRTKAGSVVGWIMTGSNSDHYIDFGIFNGSDGRVRDFVNGREHSILLDFNVDGVIFDKIDTPREALSWQMER